MKVSFIIVTSSTKGFAEYDKKSWPEIDKELDERINLFTNSLITQILEFPFDKEVLVLDNTNDFKQTVFSPEVKVLEGFYSLLTSGRFTEDLSIPVGDPIPLGGNHTSDASMNFNMGLKYCTGDYVIMQHNDTRYLFDQYESKSMIEDAIKLLEEENLEYITVDKKPRKNTSPKHVQYFSDCYWFLCRKDFYIKHKIWVDWGRGDTNHLATIHCVDNKLDFLHLPGYYELDSGFEGKAWFAFNETKGFARGLNIHYLNRKPFLYHVKGGTGLRGITKKEHFNGKVNYI